MNVRRTSNRRRIFSFRHSSPFAKLLSVIVAVAVAGLIAFVAGPASASGGGSAAGAAGAGSVGPSSLTKTSTSAPAKKPSSATSAASSGAASTGKVALTSKQSFSSQLKLLAQAAAALSVCGPQDPTPPGPVVIGGFEIDGNTCTNGNDDWDNLGAHKFDDVKDDTAYTQGDSESTAASGWHTGGSSQGKDDITDAWSYTQLVSGQVWTYFGVNRVADNGTTTYDVELNHLNNTAPQRPNRSEGDLLLQFSVNGVGPLLFDKAYVWTLTADLDASCFGANDGGGWCTLNTVVPPDFESRVSGDGLFAEGAINLSALADANGDICTGNFGQMNVRTVASEQHTAAIQDYVVPFDVKVPSTCGTIVINKYDSGSTLVGGAHFTISPDPTPGSNLPGPIDLVDGGTGDADNTADGVITINPAQPGDYTVTETQAPPGYLLPADVDHTIHLAPGAGETATFNFHDPTKWKALTGSKSTTPTYTAQYAWSIDKEVSADGNDPWVTDSSILTPLLKNVPPSGNPTDATLSYRVKVTAGARTTSNYAVSGAITVTNPNSDPVTANISDALPGATCLVAGEATHTVAVPSGSTPYPYVCTFAGIPSANELSGTNTASVTWDKSDYPQNDADQTAVGVYSISPDAPYAFGAETTSVNKTVTVTDDHHVFPGGFQVSWTAEGAVTTSDVYTIPFQAVPGNCSAVITNTATITGDSDVLGTSSASGQVCVPLGLTVGDTAVGDFSRVYHWKIDKFVDGDQKSQTVTTDDLKATFDYTVSATPLEAVDSNWVVSGKVTVTNPNQNNLIDPIHVTGVSELLDLGVAADCTYDKQVPFDLASGAHQDVGFTCTVPPTPNNDGAVPPAYKGTHQAKADYTGGSVSSAVQDLTWNTPTETDKTIAVYDNKVTEGAAPVHLGDAVWNAAGTPTTFTYQLSFSVPADTEGSCAPPFDNLAWLGGNGVTPTDVQSGATAIICVPAVLPPPPVVNPLPPTGGPDGRLLLLGLVLLGTGGVVVLMTSRRRERRS